eukprot:gb/GEZN01005687.1/.p1 GENE.gb/GEZN01005687.1/~~gb/GEZN01005687.1/.p1  ORF type:complete len:524 (+),score=41.86 gb/GEZN01005687.1/:167-1738(+)
MLCSPPCISFRRLLVLVLLLAPLARPSLARTKARKADLSNPNIWSIVADDLTIQVLRMYNGRLAKHVSTPNIDRLAREGVKFQNAFTIYPLCCPSRSTLLTGQFAHKHGVRHLKSVHDHPGFPRTMPKNLKFHGYETAIFGKWHVPMHNLNTDYSDFAVINNEHEDFYSPTVHYKQGNTYQTRKYNKAKHMFCDNLFVDLSLTWLDKNRDKTKPFYLSTHFKGCHEPFLAPYDLMTLLSGEVFAEPPGFFNKVGIINSSMVAMPFDDWIQKAFDRQPRYPDWGVPPKGRDWSKETLWRKSYQILIQLYLQCVVGMDRHVGRILDYMDARNLAHNTVVMFTADHGFFLGEHSWFDKRTVHEESTRVPLLFRFPGHIPANTVNTKLVSNADLVSTLMDFAGYSPVWEVDGTSLVKLAKGATDQEQPWPDYLYLHVLEMPRDPPYIAHCAIRTMTHKLVFLEGLAPPLGHQLSKETAWDLFDLTTDPLELHNLFTPSMYFQTDNTFQYLKALLAGEVARFNDTCPF